MVTLSKINFPDVCRSGSMHFDMISVFHYKLTLSNEACSERRLKQGRTKTLVQSSQLKKLPFWLLLWMLAEMVYGLGLSALWRDHLIIQLWECNLHLKLQWCMESMVGWIRMIDKACLIRVNLRWNYCFQSHCQWFTYYFDIQWQDSSKTLSGDFIWFKEKCN